jgi:gliding motility-associated-like protein
MSIRIWVIFLAFLLGRLTLQGQCDQNLLINQGFEDVGPPCGTVPVGGLINGSFNQGCMTGWEAAWGTPSVCSNNPGEGDYYACLGANNEGFFQTIDLFPDSTYCISFYFRRLNSGSGSLDVYLASGLVNQPTGNSGNPPITVLPSWQLLGSFPANSNQWEQIIIPGFMQLDPANNQLLFLDVPTGGLDVGIDDVKLAIPENADPNVQVGIECAGQSGSDFTFEGSLNPFPPGYDDAQWFWTFGDGQSGSGEVVTHTFDAYGQYEICLTVFIECGCAFTGCVPFSYTPCTCACGDDMEPPQFVNFNPGPILVNCLADIPEPQAPTISDCDPAAFLVLEEAESGPPCNRNITYRWIASDLCGNTSEMTQTILYENVLSPQFSEPPATVQWSCPDYLPEFLLWINEFGGASVSDECGVVNLSVDYDPTFSGGCGEVPVDFIATDECGNQSVMQASFLYTDEDAPELLVFPQDIVFPCTGVVMSELDLWLDNIGGAVVVDACSDIAWSNDFSGDVSDPVVEVSFVGEDECENILSFSAFIVQSNVDESTFDTVYTCDEMMVGIDTVLQVNQACTLFVITNRILVPSDLVFDTTLVCDPLQVGSDTAFYLNRFGCDSLHILTSTLAASDTLRAETFTCDPMLAGMDTTYFANIFGCDSLIILTTMLASTDTIRNGTITCDPAGASVDTLVYTGADGCDSIVINSVVFSGGQFTIEDEVILCGQGVDYSDTVQVQAIPCDSLLITHYSFAPLDTTRLTTHVCSPGDTGTFSMVLQSINGCDSTILMTNVYYPPDSMTVIQYTCFGLDTMVEGLWLSDQFGCDSLFVTFYLINATPDTQFVQQASCDSSMIGTTTESIPGTICDTVRVIETTWIPSYMTIDTQRLCEPPLVAADTFYFIAAGGCDSIVILGYLQDGPQMDILAGHETCNGSNNGFLQVTEVIGGTPPYVFSFDGGAFGPSMMWDSIAPGLYAVIVEDSGMCRDTVNAPITTGIPFSIDAGPDITVGPGAFVTLQLPSGTEWITGNWQAVDAVACPTCPLTQLGPITQEQFVNVSVINQAGCVAIDSFAVYLLDAISYAVPNVFSPDFDGVNDYFFLSSSASTIADYDIVIFDRWGNQVFNANDIRTNDPAVGWDGLFRGQTLNPGVYVYVIEVKPEGSRPKTISGNVTLLR